MAERERTPWRTLRLLQCFKCFKYPPFATTKQFANDIVILSPQRVQLFGPLQVPPLVQAG